MLYTSGALLDRLLWFDKCLYSFYLNVHIPSYSNLHILVYANAVNVFRF